jgi:putative membrane protein
MKDLVKSLASIAAATALLVSASALADTSSTFVEGAIKGNLAEVKVGELAQKNGASQGVKDYGRMLETDHGKANEQAKNLAKTVGATVPTEPKPEAKAEYDKLAKMNGAAFDKEFVTHMVDDHKKDIAEYEKASKDSNADVAKFAQQTLPTLRHHLDMAQSLQNQVK